MRFRESSTHPYFNKTDQVRMLKMVGVLGLVLLCMKLAADPKMWHWMFPPDAPKAAKKEGNKSETAKKSLPFDVKFDEDPSLGPDVFRTQLTDPPPAEEKKIVANPGQEKPSEIAVDPKLLEPITDNWLGIRDHEANAYYTLIAKARKLPTTLIESHGERNVDYSVLMTDSKHYRGKLITIEGTVRRLKRIPLTEKTAQEQHGMDHYFEAWMFTSSSGENPYRVICSLLPEGITLPKDEKTEWEATVTGYFFKRQGYPSQGGFHVAPVLIAQRIQPVRSEGESTAPTTGDMGLAPYVIGLALMIALGLGVMIWRFNKSDKAFGNQHIEHFTTATPSAIRELEHLETNDPGELFRQMEQDARDAELEAELDVELED